MIIPFTQYLMPDGRAKEVSFECEEYQDSLVQDLVNAGCRFEVEMLSTGEVSLTVEYEDPNGENITLAHEICPNGPEVGIAIEQLIHGAHVSYKEIEYNEVRRN